MTSTQRSRQSDSFVSAVHDRISGAGLQKSSMPMQEVLNIGMAPALRVVPFPGHLTILVRLLLPQHERVGQVPTMAREITVHEDLQRRNTIGSEYPSHKVKKILSQDTHCDSVVVARKASPAERIGVGYHMLPMGSSSKVGSVHFQSVEDPRTKPFNISARLPGV